MSDRPVTSVLWSSARDPGLERCTLFRGAGWRIDGAVLLASQEAPAEIHYQVRCDGEWRTRAVRVRVRELDEVRELSLVADGSGRWRRDGRDLTDVQGCLDVDLGFTPATNTLPVRRLNLAVGEAADIEAAWIRFPDLTIQRAPQRYTRLAADRYLYESRDGGFSAEVTVDHFGFVASYGGVWDRVASWSHFRPGLGGR